MKKCNLTQALATLSLLCAETLMMPSAHAVQQLFCNGRMNNGWSYSAEYIDGQFSRIRWTRQGKPPQTTNLTYDTINNKDQPIYRGGLMGALGVTLIDLSGGNVRPGSQISVMVDDWGSSRGNCGTSSSSTGTAPMSNVLSFRTKSYSVRVDRKNQEYLMTVVNRNNNRSLLNNASASLIPPQRGDAGWTSYVHRGGVTVYARTNPRGLKEVEVIQSTGRRVIEKAI